MKELLISKDLTPFEKELKLARFFQTYQPQTSPFLLGEFALSYQDYQKLSEYFCKQELAESFYRYPAIFAFLMTEFAYWTGDWENNSSFWESFEKHFNVSFSQTIYQTVRKGYRHLGVISQPEKGFKYVNWCTMQSILGRNAVKRLAELIQYFKHSNIQKDQIRNAFENSVLLSKYSFELLFH